MAKNRSWQSYPDNYRAEEIKTLAGWIAAGESGSVVGLVGCGRSNVLGFLCHRPEILQTYLPPYANRVIAILVDLNNLPTNDLSTLYRTILRAFYQFKDRFDPDVQQTITEVYLENRAAQDPFLPQSALHDLLLQLQDEEIQIALILNRFDRFCKTATPQMLNTLRGLRDSFKDMLCYIVGMRQEVGYLPDPTALGDMYELLDNHICWVGAMNESDARYMATQIVQAAPSQPSDMELAGILALSGRFPILIKAICHWWLAAKNKPSAMDWEEILGQQGNLQFRLERLWMAEGSMHYRLERMWNGLTQEEQLTLSEVQKLQIQRKGKSSKKFQQAMAELARHHQVALDKLVTKGLCWQTTTGWEIAGNLLAAFIAQTEGRSRGKIWWDEATQEIHQGQKTIEGLTSLQKSVLSFLVKNPRAPHTKTDLIINTWPDELRDKGVSDDALYQVIGSLRQKIEPKSAEPRYLITWRGRPEGGYKFFPEGKPE